jgi:sigma-70-like protein
VALADPDLPAGVTVPELSVDPPRGFGAQRYRLLRAAFDGLPRRSRVILVLRLGFAGRRPLTLRAIGDLLGIGHERVRQLEHHAVWMLVRAWRPYGSPADLSSDERMALLVPIADAAIDRYPLDGDPAGGAS